MKKQFFFLLLFAIIAYGQQQERVAIIQTVDDGDSIKFSDLAYLTDRLRETAVNILPKQRYGVMTMESIVAFLGSQERAMKECRESSCLADLGRKVNADYVAQGRIGRFDGNLTIKTELYNSKSGNLIGSFTGASKGISGLLAIVDEKAPILFKKMLDTDDTSDLEKAVDYKLDEEENYSVSEKTNWAKPEFEKPIKTSFWVALGLDVIGATIICVGYAKDREMAKALDKYNVSGQSSSYYGDAWNDVESKRSSRNTLYVIGGIILASGIGVHIWF
jgi:TolB-like protein